MKTVPNAFDRLGPDTALRPRIPKEESIVARHPQSKRLHREWEDLNMAEIPLSWRAYATHQSNLNSRTSVDATSWGVEAGLNYLLEGGNLDAPLHDVDRVVASAARRGRYSKSLLAKYVIAGEEIGDDASHLEARSSLAALRRSIPSASLSLLFDLAAGFEFSELVVKHGNSAGALRTRAARVRQSARELAA